jgi:hypothetical protein
LPQGVEVARVTVRYRAFGGEQWKTLALKKMGAGWGGEIPCSDIGDSVGDVKYFVHAIDENGDLVAASGRLVKPRIVHIVAQPLEGAPPHLPDQPPPARCTQKTDCPPGFPGCHAEAGKTACVSDDECASQQCSAGFCVELPPEPTEEGPYKDNWISIAFQADFLLLPQKNDVCLGGTGYTCFSGSSYYSAIPLMGADDVVSGGLALSTLRIVLGYDRALGQNLLVGGRLGYAFNGGPQRPGGAAFLPVNLEARASYWFGHGPLGRSGLRFFALLGGGLEEVDGSVAVDTYASPMAYANKQSQNFTAWKKSGNGFVELGPGVMYAVTPNSGILVEAKGVLLFPTSGTGASVQLGYAIGL